MATLSEQLAGTSGKKPQQTKAEKAAKAAAAAIAKKIAKAEALLQAQAPQLLATAAGAKASDGENDGSTKAPATGTGSSVNTGATSQQ